ncbi:hypothetical protein Q8F55_000602 [Vanrija albida]|uniref:ACB domain-containing protein n=1 Tax=Vanrija albida TaxID=181172 RepID=A0ABR3QDR0_9TREE
MATTNSIDKQFHRAVDIVQSLPKSGPVQTSYEEKLQLYALYKQATEGDISAPRPGMLDMLGRAKWDSWNKVKGVNKAEAKQLYIAALIKIFQRFEYQSADAKRYIAELEAMGPLDADRPASPASSTSSFHSSHASPLNDDERLDPLDGRRASQTQSELSRAYAPPDPSLPAPDVAPNIIPPSALNTSYRSLVNLANPSAYGSENQSFAPPVQPFTQQHPSGPYPMSPFAPPGGSRPQSLFGGVAGSVGDQRDPLANLRSARRQQGTPSLSFVPEHPVRPPTQVHQPPQQQQQSGYPIARDFGTPDNVPHHYPSPYLPHPSPYLQRPASVSTFSQAPLNLPATLASIQTSLQALHERLATLEHSQAMILRRQNRKRHWFWGTSEADELEDAELDAEAARWGGYGQPSTTVRVRRRQGLSARVIFALLTAIRRAILGVGATVIVGTIALLLMNGGMRRNAKKAWDQLRGRMVRLLTDAAH